MSDRSIRVELYLRSLAPSTARTEQDRVVERLEAHDTDGRIDGFEIGLCGDCVCPFAATARSDLGERLLSRYDAFQEWARERDRELVGFEERDTKSMLTGTNVTGIVFPRITLAEYTDGELSFVAPSRDGTETTRVVDRIQTY